MSMGPRDRREAESDLKQWGIHKWEGKRLNQMDDEAVMQLWQRAFEAYFLTKQKKPIPPPKRMTWDPKKRKFVR